MTQEAPANAAERLAGIVALQLVPGNLHYLDALTRLTAYAVRHATGNDLAEALADFESRAGLPLTQMRGTFTGFAAVEVPFFTRTHLVLQGLTGDAGIVVRHLLPAIFGRLRNRFPSTFVRNVDAAARFLLSTSDLLSAHMQLGWFSSAPPATTLVLPDDARRRSLAGALSLDEAEFFDGLPGEMTAYLRTMFFTDLAELPTWDGNDIDEALVARPFLRTGDGNVVIAAPHELMVTLRHAICIEATAHDCHRQLQAALTVHAARLSRHLCDFLFDGDPTARTSVGFSTLQGAFDTDKVLEIRTHVPSLEASSGSVLGDVLTMAPPPPQPSDRSVPRLTVDVFWPSGRDFHLLSPGEDRHLSTTFEDLETILHTSGTHQLSLWYFAEALDRLNESTMTVLHSGLADLYGLYIEGDESFYPGDDSPPPTALVVESDYSEELRRKLTERLGRRFVHIANVVHESFLCHGEATSVREVLAFPRVIFSADFDNFAIWVELEVRDPVDTVRLRSFAEAVAYWAFHVYTAQPDLFAAFDGDVQTLLVEADWTDEDDPRWIRCGPQVDGKHLTFEFRRPSPPDRSAAPNVLDRELLAEFLASLRNTGGSSHTNDQADPLLESLAPPGERRMLHVVRSDVDPIAWPGALPSARTVSRACVAKLLDELGTHLRSDCGRTVGDIADVERTSVLNVEVVAFLRDRLMARLSEFDFLTLLDYLIRANEALLHQQYVERVRYPSRLACFGHASHEVRDLAKRISESTTAAVSSRFLIELVAGIQPESTAAPTLERCDEILAAASEIVNKGFLSDAIHAGLSDAQLMILPSGRLGIARDTDRYLQGLQSLLSANAQAVLDDAAGTAEQDPGDKGSEGSLSEADRLAIVEWGFSFTELTAFTGELINLSTERDQQDVGLLPVDDVRQRVFSEFGWGADKISALLSELSLSHETDFWSLGSDVFPWRYNRARSYLRRPLIAYTHEGADHVMFGHRNTLRTSYEMHGQYNSGRLKAQTPEMKAALSAANNQKGDAFEDRVAEDLRRWCYPVRRRARRFGHHDLRNIDGRNLGDIDIVAFHEASQTLYLIEAKALLVARTPREMAHEFASLIEGRGSAADRLRARYEWVTDNMADVLQALGIAAPSATISPLIVIDADVLSARFICLYPIMTAAKLRELFE